MCRMESICHVWFLKGNPSSLMPMIHQFSANFLGRSGLKPVEGWKAPISQRVSNRSWLSGRKLLENLKWCQVFPIRILEPSIALSGAHLIADAKISQHSERGENRTEIGRKAGVSRVIPSQNSTASPTALVKTSVTARMQPPLDTAEAAPKLFMAHSLGLSTCLL